MDAADTIVIEAYRDQMLHSEPKRFPFLLTCLESIATDRSSEAIQEECVIELSRGRYDVKAVSEAFKSLGLEWKEDARYDDEYILGIFNSRLEDMRMHERELRDHLRIIGDFRGSRVIRDAAENGKCDSTFRTGNAYQIPSYDNL